MLFLQILVWLALAGTTSGRDLLVGAFNIQIFGKTKAKKAEVMAVLVKIVRRYDLLLIQEIRDNSANSWAINQLLDQVNEGQSEPFSMVLSERIGRTSSKEQYAYLYRPASGLHVMEQFVYDDAKMKDGKQVDLFERQPFVVYFSSSKTELGSFGLIGIHVDPDKAVEEINDLYTYVIDDVRVKIRQENLMVLGDLNADCNYVSKSKWKKIPMKTDRSYNWLIGDEQDTTVKGTHCAYDRFISTGHGWADGIVPGSARVYRFDQDKTIGNIDQALAVKISDHYPIEFLLAEKQYSIIMVSYRVYINLVGAYKDRGSLQQNMFYELTLKDKTERLLSVYDKPGRRVGELSRGNDDEKLLTKVLLELTRSRNMNIKMYIQPVANRYADRQRSELYIAVSATDDRQVSLLWNKVNGVCKQTYFKCSKDF